MAWQRALARARRQGQTTHIIFVVCDHFEPRHGARDAQQPFTRLDTWQREYAAFQQRCKSEFGTSPVHTWFYPPHHGSEHLARLAEMAFDGLGEVELHYHHDGDTAASLRANLIATLEEYARWGLLVESGEAPRTRFGFIHGDWALGNSGGGRYCGVNEEVSILQDLGCWGDFTMPSGNRCQTRKINSIYYGVGTPDKPKAHDWGQDAQVGAIAPDGLFMMQGPLAINWRAPNHPRPENGSLTSRNWGRGDRIPVWLNCNVHVRGKPEWLFVKLHTHGALERDYDALFGDKAFRLHQVLNQQYNDGARYRLHYATAREAYNIAKAAENGESGDPSLWRNYRIQPPATRFYSLDATHRLTRCIDAQLSITNIDGARPVRLRMQMGSIAEINGLLRSVDIDEATGSVKIETHGDVDIALLWRCAPGDLEIASGDGVAHVNEDGSNCLKLKSSGGCTLRFRNAK